jgi:hypothetical protein
VPAANLTIRIAEAHARVGIWGFTPIVFDATASSGKGLAYRIDFGDGANGAAPVTTHVPKPDFWNSRRLDQDLLRLTSTLTVTDERGQTSMDVQEYDVLLLASPLGPPVFWLNVLGPSDTNSVRKVFFYRQDGATLTGSYLGPEGSSSLTATLSGQRDIRIRLSDIDVELGGEFHLEDDLSGSRRFMRLAVRGGPANGMTLDFERHTY